MPAPLAPRCPPLKAEKPEVQALHRAIDSNVALAHYLVSIEELWLEEKSGKPTSKISKLEHDTQGSLVLSDYCRDRLHDSIAQDEALAMKLVAASSRFQQARQLLPEMMKIKERYFPTSSPVQTSEPFLAFDAGQVQDQFKSNLQAHRQKNPSQEIAPSVLSKPPKPI